MDLMDSFVLSLVQQAEQKQTCEKNPKVRKLWKIICTD